MKKSETVKVNWSGGKDSTCAVLKHLEAEHHVKAVNYIPMLTSEIPLLVKSHYEFILLTAEKFKNMGAELYFVKGITYFDFVCKRSTRGKYKGRMFGFPSFIVGKCNFNRDSKTRALTKTDIGYFDYEDIGLAADETKRLKLLTETKRSILIEQGITEAQAFEYCYRQGFLSPIYTLHGLKRDGCALCPQAPERERQLYFNDYPKAREIVIELQNIVKKNRPEQTPLRNHKWFVEECKKNEIEAGENYTISEY